MLVISRRAGERILIGDNVWVTVVKLEGNRIRLGIDAPLEVPVRRGEILDADRLDEPAAPASPAPLSSLERLAPHEN